MLMKKRIIISVLTVTIILTMTVVLVLSNNENIEKDIEGVMLSAEADWVPIDGGDTEEAVVNNTTFIGVGKVIGTDTEIRGDEGGEMVFTINHVLITKIYAVDEEETSDIAEDISGNSLIVDVLQTGGVFGEFKTLAFDDAPLLEQNIEYLLFLNKTEDGYYLPVGGRLGIAEIVNGKIEFTNDEAAAILSSFEGDKVSKIISDLLNVADEVDNNILINESGESVLTILDE
jgi:hypothetical protein